MGIKFNVKVDVKKKFVVNGKEYNSLDELPEDVRAAYETALAARKAKGGDASSAEQSAAEESAKEQALAQAMSDQPIQPASSSKALRLLIALAAAALLLFGLYYVVLLAGRH